MSTEIDWSKIHPQQRKDVPALTTHFAVGTHDHSFVKLPDRYIWAPAYKCWHPMSKIDYQDWFFDRLIPIEQYESLIPNQWQGEGLPPVGTVCEFKAGHSQFPELSWTEVRIVSHDNQGDRNFAVFASVSGYGGCSDPADFRPLRTPEQIATEERAKLIAELYNVITGPGDCWAKAARAIDAGYRLTPQRQEVA